MDQYMKCSSVILTLLFISLNANALPSPSSKETNTNLPPLIFPKNNVTLGAGLPPVLFPSDNATVGVGPTNATKNVTIGYESNENATDVPKDRGAPELFPKTNDSVPLINLPPLIFPEELETPMNKTALDILNAKHAQSKPSDKRILPPFDRDYYKENSNEETDINDEVEEVQGNDNGLQTDDLEENYKSDMHILPVSEFDDDTEVDHPLLRNTHFLGTIGAVLAVLCICLYLGITVWRRAMFNRYGMRERLVNEDDFYSNKSIHHNF